MNDLVLLHSAQLGLSGSFVFVLELHKWNQSIKLKKKKISKHFENILGIYIAVNNSDNCSKHLSRMLWIFSFFVEILEKKRSPTEGDKVSTCMVFKSHENKQKKMLFLESQI